MTTVGALVTEVQRRFLSDMREETDSLGQNIIAGAGQITLASGETLGSIVPGAVLQIDYELFFVTSAPNTQQIFVIPGYYGTTQSVHFANTQITVNPHIPVVDIIRSFNEELDDFSAATNGLFQVKEITLSYNPVIRGYDMTDINTDIALDPTTWLDLLEVRTHEYGPAQIWPHTPLSQIALMWDQDTSVFPSGTGLRFDGTGYAGRPIRVLYKSTFTSTLANATDDVLAVSGLHAQAHDILTLGAAYRLMPWREIKRSFTEAQSEPRRAQEVPVGSSLTAMKGLMQQRTDRLAAERSRLEAKYKRRWR